MILPPLARRSQPALVLERVPEPVDVAGRAVPREVGSREGAVVRPGGSAHMAAEIGVGLCDVVTGVKVAGVELVLVPVEGSARVLGTGVVMCSVGTEVDAAAARQVPVLGEIREVVRIGRVLEGEPHGRWWFLYIRELR